MPTARRPRSRNEFEIAVICTLRAESDAVEALFDEFWDEDDSYGKAAGDPNAYTAGRIGKHNLVLAYMPGMGTGTAASVAASFRSSFPGIKLGLVVGVCGGVPTKTDDGDEILLGDVIISTGLVQYNFGRQLPDRVVRKDTLLDSLSRPNSEIRAFLAKVAGRRGRARLKDSAFSYLSELYQHKIFQPSDYPGADEDKLFEPTYRHKHQDAASCAVCRSCNGDQDQVCGFALEAPCAELGCDDSKLVHRDRLHEAMRNAVHASTSLAAAQLQKPLIHFGLIASGDLVVKSGFHRDRVAREEGVIAFEMEGAGVWDNIPTVVIKGVCDYADSHKNKKWQRHAAATAAACMKAFLKEWRTTDKPAQGEACLAQENPVVIKAQEQHVQMFRTMNYEAQKDRNPMATSNTCQWFLNHSNYHRWRDSTTSELLWVSADPGCGKSVLARTLIDEAFESMGWDPCFFFFRSDADQSQNTPSGALCAILHQLFSRYRHLVEYAEAAIKRNGPKLLDLFEDLWQIFIDIATNSSGRTLVCVLDGLDECSDSDRLTLIRKIKHFYQQHLTSRSYTGTVVKFLITSRPYVFIERDFRDMTRKIPEIRLAGEDETQAISEEIDVVVDSRVKEVALQLDLSHEIAEALKTRLLSTPNRTYLWVNLVFEEILRSPGKTQKKLLGLSNKLPETIEEAYESILARVVGEKEASRLLHIVIAAERPLTVGEADVALAIQDCSRCYKDLDLEGKSAKEYVRHLCGLFVNVIDDRLYFIHETAREFLIRQRHCQTNDSDNRQQKVWRHSFDLEESHKHLAQICLSYLLFEEFESDPLTVELPDQSWSRMVPLSRFEDDGSTAFQTRSLQDAFKYSRYGTGTVIGGSEIILNSASARIGTKKNITRYCFLEYSACFWHIHFREAQFRQEDPITRSVLKRLYDTNSKTFWTWFSVYYWADENIRSGMAYYLTALTIAMAFRHDTIIQLMLNSEAEVHSRSPFGLTAMHWAAANHDIEYMKLLNAKGANLNVQDPFGATPLHLAVNSAPKVVAWLIENGADVNMLDTNGLGPLHECLFEENALLLIRKGANMNQRDRYNRTLLFKVAVCDHARWAQLLFENGAELDMEAYSLAHINGSNRFLDVCHQHHPDLARQMGTQLKASQDVGSLLRDAAGAGDLEAVQLTLEVGAAVNSFDRSRETALHIAARNGFRDIVLTLLSYGANLEAKDMYGQTPMMSALKRGDGFLVELFLNKGVDLQWRDKDGRTLLHLAAEYDLEDISELLINRGLAIDARNTLSGHTPLFEAVHGFGKQYGIVKLFLRKGACINARALDGKTPISLAVREHDRLMVEILLSEGADVHLTDLNGLSLLHHELLYKFSDDIEMLRLLLECGVNPALEDNAGLTAMDYLVYGGGKERPHMIELLGRYMKKGQMGHISPQNKKHHLSASIRGRKKQRC